MIVESRAGAGGLLFFGHLGRGLAQFIVEDSAKWKRVAEAAGIQPE